MHVKVTKGTDRGGFHLCDKCGHSRTRTHEDGYVERQCTASDSELSHWARVRNSRVIECSSYMHGGIHLNAMYSIAWQFYKNDDGHITFIDQNSRRNPQVASARMSRWRKFISWLRRGK